MKFKCYLYNTNDENNFTEIEFNDMQSLKTIARANRDSQVHIDFERMIIVFIPTRVL